MRKKISIWSLTVFFLLSTTGLPVWYHYCEVTNAKALTACDDCSIEKKSVSCCEEESTTAELNVTAANSNCCIDILDYQKIDDNYFQNINSVFPAVKVTVIEPGSLSDDNNDITTFSKQENFNRPPPKFGKELLNTIHQLKIDLPVC